MQACAPDSWWKQRLRALRCGAVAGALIIIGTSACGTGGPSALIPGLGDGPTPECNASNALTISTAGTVQFSWAPRCAVGGLGVATDDGVTAMWGLGTADGRATITGPVVYGQLPAGATQHIAPKPLQPGTRYRVLLSGTAMGPVAPLVMMGSFVMPE